MAEKKIVVIRPASPMDSVNIVRLLRSQYDESAARTLCSFDDTKILRYITGILSVPDALHGAYCIVAEKDGRLLGSLALTRIPVPWNAEATVMAEAWFAVIAQYRAKGVGDRLLDEAEKMLDILGWHAFIGTNMYTSNGMDEMIRARPRYTASRTAFLRAPKPKATVQ